MSVAVKALTLPVLAFKMPTHCTSTLCIVPEWALSTECNAIFNFYHDAKRQGKSKALSGCISVFRWEIGAGKTMAQLPVFATPGHLCKEVLTVQYPVSFQQ